MRALSIKQPWAWLIVNGFKDIENRTWPTRRTGEILIHASTKYAHVNAQNIRRMMQNDQEYDRLLYEAEQPGFFGGLVGKATIIDCVSSHESIWFEGPWGFVLENQQKIDFIPYKGKLSFFEVDLCN